jgi:hypothetical protein
MKWAGNVKRINVRTGVWEVLVGKLKERGHPKELGVNGS